MTDDAKQTAWRQFCEQLEALGVNPHSPEVLEDDPRHEQVQAIVAEYRGIPLPLFPLPESWEGTQPLFIITSLDDVARWLRDEWGNVTATRMGSDDGSYQAKYRANQTLRNAHRILDDLGIEDRPERQPPAESLEECEQEYLHDRGWTIEQSAEVRIEKIPEYEKLAPEMLALYEKSNCVQTVASAYGIAWDRTKEILEFAKTGKRPKWKAGRRTGNGVRADYERIAPIVVELRDSEKLPWSKIQTRLANVNGVQVSITTIRRAYDYFHQDEVLQAANRGLKPDRGRSRQISNDSLVCVHTWLRIGVPIGEVAERAGCSISTVRREKKALGL